MVSAERITTGLRRGLAEFCVLGILARASRSILPAVALHFANNITAEWLGGA